MYHTISPPGLQYLFGKKEKISRKKREIRTDTVCLSSIKVFEDGFGKELFPKSSFPRKIT
jgi:hypothetical protein